MKNSRNKKQDFDGTGGICDIRIESGRGSDRGSRLGGHQNSDFSPNVVRSLDFLPRAHH